MDNYYLITYKADWDDECDMVSLIICNQVLLEEFQTTLNIMADEKWDVHMSAGNWDTESNASTIRQHITYGPLAKDSHDLLAHLIPFDVKHDPLGMYLYFGSIDIFYAVTYEYQEFKDLIHENDSINGETTT